MDYNGLCDSVAPEDLPAPALAPAPVESAVPGRFRKPRLEASLSSVATLDSESGQLIWWFDTGVLYGRI